MDAKRAIKGLDLIHGVRPGPAFSRAEQEEMGKAIEFAKAALKAQGEPVYQCRYYSSIGDTKCFGEWFDCDRDVWESALDRGLERRTLYTAPEQIGGNDSPLRDSQPAQAVPWWQPIESAPLDGTRLLLFRASDEMQFTGSWCDCYGWSDLNAPIAGVTHWMPLPAAPAPGGDVCP